MVPSPKKILFCKQVQDLYRSCPKGSSTCDEVTGGGGGGAAAHAVLSKSREVPGK